MSQFVLVRNFFEGRKLETTKVVGIFTSLTDAQARANELVKETRDDMEWEGDLEKWEWDDHTSQWTTTDFPPDDIHHRYIIDTL
jgi:hypothetical protein